MPEHVASISYGKDSLAMLHVIVNVLHWPLDRIVTADEWATEDVPTELPEQIAFEERMDELILERFGIQVEHVYALTKTGEKVTFEKEFYKVRRKASNREGEIVGWPRLFGCWANKRLKLRALDRIRDSMKGCLEYIGIAANETERISRHAVKGTVRMPLVDAGWDEEMCLQWCKDNDMLAPCYRFSNRSGCFFCPAQPIEQLRILRHEHPELWQLMLRWDADSPTYFKPWHHDGLPSRKLIDYDKRFTIEDAGFADPEKRFDWRLLDSVLYELSIPKAQDLA